MRKFVKGKLETIVEDSDRRIPEYLANGWKEAPLGASKPNSKTSATDKALNDVAASEGANKAPKSNSKNNRGSKSGKTGKPSQTDQKVNDAISANSNTAVEGAEVDDGLEKKGGD